MKMHLIAALVAVGVAMSGCASIVKGTSQSIAITSPPTTGAQCTLSSREGNWMVTTPGAVTVQKSKDDMTVRCTKPGWQDAVGMIPSNFQGWTVGNIIFGGIIGLGVDAATGAINEYPNAYQVPMTPLSSPPPPSGKPTS